MQTLRTFTAIPLPDDITARIVRLQEACPSGRDVPEENLHLTLAFHGDQPLDRLEDLDDSLATRALPAPTVTLKGIDIFGGKTRGGIALMAETTDDLASLHAACTRAARSAGIALERRRFRPHVTIARFSRPPDPLRFQTFLDKHGSYGPLTFTPRNITLFRSTLSHEGAVYDALADYPLTVPE